MELSQNRLGKRWGFHRNRNGQPCGLIILCSITGHRGKSEDGRTFWRAYILGGFVVLCPSPLGKGDFSNRGEENRLEEISLPHKARRVYLIQLGLFNLEHNVYHVVGDYGHKGF